MRQIWRPDGRFGEEGWADLRLTRRLAMKIRQSWNPMMKAEQIWRSTMTTKTIGQQDRRPVAKTLGQLG